MEENGAASGPKNIDISNVTVDPVFKASPRFEEAKKEKAGKVEDGYPKILFVSESGVCRSVIAMACLKRALVDHGLADVIEVGSKASRHYCAGEGPEPAALRAAEELGLELEPGYEAVKFKDAEDIVNFDAVMAFDKYTVADILRDVTVFDTIDSSGQYCRRVRSIAEFHPDEDIEEVDDGLYGMNCDSQEAIDAVLEAAKVIDASCIGFAKALADMKAEADASEGDVTMREVLIEKFRTMEELDWLKPPLLSSSQALDNHAYDQVLQKQTEEDKANGGYSGAPPPSQASGHGAVARAPAGASNIAPVPTPSQLEDFSNDLSG